MKRFRFCLLTLLLVMTQAHAVEHVLLETGRIRTRDVTMEKARLVADLANPGSPVLQARVESLWFGAGPRLESLKLDCPRLLLFRKEGGRCDGISFSFVFPPLGELRGTADYLQQLSRTELRLDALKLGKGTLNGRITGSGEQWQGSFRLRDLELGPLFGWLLPQWSGAGKVEMTGQGERKAERWTLRATAGLQSLRFSDPEGLRVGEGLAGRVSVAAGGGGDLVRGELALVLRRGQLYGEPFYLELQGERPLSLVADIEGHPGQARWTLREFGVDYPDILKAEGAAELHSGRLARLDLEYRAQDLGAVYALLLQPLLIGTAADELQVKGRVDGTLAVVGEEPKSLALNLENVQIEDGGQRYGFTGLQGRLRWTRTGPVEDSRLGWRGGHLYRVPLGAVEVDFLARGGRLEVRPFAMEVLEGTLKLRDLWLEGLLDGALRWQGGMILKSIQLRALSRALQWPPLEGEMNAVVPRVHYRDRRLQLDGKLVVEIFGGRVVVEGLQVDDPLGVAPVLETNIRLENLDLAQISQAFSFGRIEGSLEGGIRNLRLVGWELSGFDARLRSPSGDSRRHRISQRAIDNLTELGNGVAAGLSGTFLGMFKDFAYDRLQLGIRLEGDTAELDGAPGPKGGYYIVKGAGLPRVDVIGRNRRVAWKDLLSRLRNIRFEEVVVE